MVLLAGMCIACITSVLEYLWNRKNQRIRAEKSSIVAKGLANTNSNMLRITGIQENHSEEKVALSKGADSSLICYLRF